MLDFYRLTSRNYANQKRSYNRVFGKIIKFVVHQEISITIRCDSLAYSLDSSTICWKLVNLFRY